MKILTVNRNYFITGGPEKYMFSLMENMPQHQFIPFCVDFEQNRETPYRKYFVSPPAGSGSVYYKEFKMSPAQQVEYAVNSIYHIEARHKLEKLIKDERPDLALFLNAVYFSDSIIDACRAHNVPIIWRMSDFHKVCANYLLYRDGNVCEECLEHGLSRAVRNKCGGYQRSLGAALIKAAGMWLSRIRRLYDHVDYFVTPSAFTREKMIQGGFRPEKIVHIPTWTGIPEHQAGYVSSSREILFVGRLSHEKGVETLLEAFKLLKCKDAGLSIIGDDTASYAQQLKASVPNELSARIHFLGFQSQERIAELFQRSTCFVVPSVWYENQPNTVLEGMSYARPAIVSDLGSMKELVVHGKTGYRFKAGNAPDLADKIADLLENPLKADEMGLQARDYIEKNHSLQFHLSSLEALFEKCAVRKPAGLPCGTG
jgi:glycosyltransferase involved in cell wall biosynthesis